MANGILMGSLVDLINNTLPHLPRGKFSETLERVNHFLVKLIFEELREDVSDGTEYQTRIRLRANETFRWSNLYGGMAPAKAFVNGIIGSPWAHFLSRGIVFDRREKNVNSGAAKIVDTLLMERSAEWENIWEQLENAMISAGRGATASADDPPSLRGIFYWLRLCIDSSNSPIADSEGGFDGVTARFDDGTDTQVYGNGSDSQVDASDAANSRVRNYNFTCPEGFNKTVEDRMALAMESTKFEGLPELKGKSIKASGRQIITVSTARKLAYESYVNAGPDDRDGDARPFHGGLNFRGVPVRKASIYDALTYDPIVGINTRHLMGVVLASRFMKEMGAIQDPFAPHVVSVPIEGTCLVHCDNPREAGWVGHIPLES